MTPELWVLLVGIYIALCILAYGLWRWLIMSGWFEK